MAYFVEYETCVVCVCVHDENDNEIFILNKKSLLVHIFAALVVVFAGRLHCTSSVPAAYLTQLCFLRYNG